ncbi:hypothetical protein CVT24_003750 [Panaeolus cyanescens]|uniref:Uncharacterized protein n=1 Tax=Panaeolus cyanescens TaxID=181874 RepID=A0A409WN89_9AGAR|nr:hypothetical protein CVT24_003750 [Panaeolus cyanescens]
MVQTRAAKRKQQEAHLALNNQPAPLAASNTVVQIVPSATGQGVHTRWIRDQEHDGDNSQPQSSSNAVQVDDNQVLVTPIRESNGIPHSPPKMLRRNAVNNARMQWHRDQGGATHVRPQGRDLTGQFQRLGDAHHENGQQFANHALASPFQDQGSSSSTLATLPTQLLSQQSTYDPNDWNNTFQHIMPQTKVAAPALPKNDEVASLLKTYRRGLGPHGTIIVDRNGDPIVPGLVNGANR